MLHGSTKYDESANLLHLDTLEKINQFIRYYRVGGLTNKDEAWRHVYYRIERSSLKPIGKAAIKTKRLLVAFAAAAVVFLVLSIQLIASFHSYEASDGPCVAILPDYSRVVLNSGSSLWYMNYFLLRNVHLDGEAYFEVQKGSTFSVRANDGMVQVLGTRFDVSEKGGDLHVNCYEGRVSVTRNGNNEVLAPGEFVEMSDNSIVHSVQRIEQYPYYALFNRDFDRVKLEQVFHEIEAFFGVKINSQTDKNRVFSGRIVSGDVDAVLEIVCQSMRLDYTREKINKIEIYEL